MPQLSSGPLCHSSCDFQHSSRAVQKMHSSLCSKTVSRAGHVIKSMLAPVELLLPLKHVLLDKVPATFSSIVGYFQIGCLLAMGPLVMLG